MDNADPALTVGLALAAGVVAQTLARHLRVPGIVLLLASGVALGPEGFGVVEPSALGPALNALVGFAVAVILFEGGLNLKLSRLRRQGRVVRRLITLGAAVTLVGGTLAVRLILGWSWQLSVLFGALVIVTGPTVVTPLLRRVRVSKSVETILEAEGVLIDAVGAIAAIVVLEVAVHPSLAAGAAGAGEFGLTFLVGVPLGALTGLLIAGSLRVRRLVPEGLENIFVLAIVLAVFQIGDAMVPEAGIVAVTVAGLIVGNLRTRVSRDLAEFKEQLTVLLIGLLFILLAASVQLEQVRALGLRGLLVVAALMFVVRPVGALVCTAGTSLTRAERIFVGWVAPRGIVAAAVASLFATRLGASGVDGGQQLVALVFLVIAVTVSVHGLTMGPVARSLGLRLAADRGYVLLGANSLGLAVGGALRDAGQEVVFIEANVDKANRATQQGFAVIFGNGLHERVTARAQPEVRIGGIALTPNEEANLLFVRRLHEEHRCGLTWVAIDRVVGHLNERLVHDAGSRVLFGHARDISLWSLWLRRERARVERRVHEVPAAPVDPAPASGVASEPVGNPAADRPRREPLVPLVVRRGAAAFPYDETYSPKAGDELWAAIDERRRSAAEELLVARGWRPSPDAAP